MNLRALPLASLLCLATAVGGVAQERLTLERIFEPSFEDAVSTPEFEFLARGEALLLDRRRPAENRTLELLDLPTGSRRPAVSAQAWMQAMVAEVGKGAVGRAARFPDAVHAGTRSALYLLAGDLVLVELDRWRLRRLTRTDEKESCPSFSPDGRRVAFVRGNDLWVVDLASGRESRLTRDGSDTLLNGTLSWVYWEELFGRRDMAYWWAPDSSAIAFLRSDESGVDVSVFPDFEPATPRVSRQRYPKAGSANPKVRLGIIDLARGRTVWADAGSPEPEYLVRVKWLPSGRELALQTLDRRQRTLRLLFVDRHRGSGRTVLTETLPTSVNIHDDLHFLDRGRSFLWTSERDGHNHLYLFGADGTLQRRLTHGGMTIRASSGVAWVRGGVLEVDEKAGYVYFTAVDGAPIAPALYRARLDGSGVERLSDKGGTHRVTFDPSGAYFLEQRSSLDSPPRLSLRRSDGSLVTVVTPPADSFLAPFGLVTPEFLTVPADDGAPLPMRILRPAAVPPGRKLPVILYVYGGPSAPVVRDDWPRDVYFDNLLLQEGFACAAVDNRSASGVSKTLEDDSYGRLMSAREVPDVLAAVRWLAAQEWVDPDRIGVWGWSGGGTLTLQLMTHSTAFKAGIAVAAVTDFRYYDTRWTEALLGLPQENPEGYRNGSPATAAADLHGRLLLVHGTGDDNVHPQNAWRFVHELVKAGVSFEMMVYPLEKHGLAGARPHVYRTMLDFWKRNL
ncbi:MAG: DPP IV N-terminal domain-containing protein [Acidobacteriota bacterium]